MNKQIFYILAFIFSGLQAGDWSQYFGKAQRREDLTRLYPEYDYTELSREAKRQEQKYGDDTIDLYNAIVFPSGQQYDATFKLGALHADLGKVPLYYAFDKEIIGQEKYRQFVKDYKKLHDKREEAVKIIKEIKKSLYQRLSPAEIHGIENREFSKTYNLIFDELVDAYKKEGLDDKRAQRKAQLKSLQIASETAPWVAEQMRLSKSAPQDIKQALMRFENAKPQWNEPCRQRREQEELRKLYENTKRKRLAKARQKARAEFGGESYGEICKRYFKLK